MKFLPKVVGIAAIVILLLPLISALDYAISDVYINDISVDSGNAISVELGVIMKVKVVVEGYNEQDVRVKGWIGGYNEVIEDYSEYFDVEEGVTYVQYLYLRIPGDLEDGTYTLHVEVYDNLERDKKEYKIYVENEDYDYGHRHIHVVDDEDVLVSFESIKDVYAGEEKQFKVLVTNLGEDSEEFYLRVDGMSVDKVVVDSGESGILYYSLLVNKEGNDDVLVSVYNDQGKIEEKSLDFDAEKRESFWAIWVGVLVAFLVVVGIVMFLKRLQEEK